MITGKEPRGTFLSWEEFVSFEKKGSKEYGIGIHQLRVLVSVELVFY